MQSSTEHEPSQLEKLFSIPPRIGPKRSLRPEAVSRAEQLLLRAKEIVPTTNSETVEAVPNNVNAESPKNTEHESDTINEPLDYDDSHKEHQHIRHHEEQKNSHKRHNNDDSNSRKRRRHDELQSGKKIPCTFYLEGRCSKGDQCTFAHVGEVKKKADLCKYFLVGACQKGEACVYSHDPSQFPCKFFHATNNCKHGEECKFSHAPMTAIQKELLDQQLKIGEPVEEPAPAVQAPPVNPFSSTLFDEEQGKPVLSFGSVFDVN
jgi:hypothetical protein